MAIVGNPAVVMGIANELPLASDMANLRLRALFVVLFLANALLKFVWANRLFGYCAIVMGAVPNDPSDPLAALRAAQAADLNIHAAKVLTVACGRSILRWAPWDGFSGPMR